MLIDVEGDRFSVEVRLGPGGRRVYDFSWINGPSEPPYGFTIGSTSPSTEFSTEELRAKVAAFVHHFYAPGGIGPVDFPEFVASRNRQ
ncbi:hypothetical protein BWO91_14500 [Plantibacter flavus]|nr:hypothetical protein BWO91_14500 [Plantibacter flavus]